MISAILVTDGCNSCQIHTHWLMRAGFLHQGQSGNLQATISWFKWE